jgi:hypothetical protein
MQNAYLLFLLPDLSFLASLHLSLPSPRHILTLATTVNVLHLAPRRQFSADGSLVAAGGTGTKDARIFDVKSDYALLGRVRLDTKGIYTLDFSANGGRIAVGGGADAIALREIVDV